MGKHEVVSKDTDQSVARITRSHEEGQKALERDAEPETPVTDARALDDARVSHVANTVQRANILSGLQRTHGNAYVQRLLSSHGAQAKLTVNAPGDRYEQEADRVADAVVKAAGATAQRQEMPEEEEVQAKLQRQPIEEEEEELQPKRLQRQEMPEEEEVQAKLQRQPIEEEEEELQPKRLQRQEIPEDEEVQAKLQRQEVPEEEEPVQTKPSSTQVPEAPDSFESQINAARSGGESLPDSLRASFEPHFGTDFSDVRIHTDAAADSLSRGLEARAFTTGNDIFFRSGDYSPDTEEGQKLIAHEMTHVLQQGGTIAREATETPATTPAAAPAPAGTEARAERAAEAQRRIWRQIVFLPLIEAAQAVRQPVPDYATAAAKCRQSETAAVDLSLSMDISDSVRSQIDHFLGELRALITRLNLPPAAEAAIQIAAEIGGVDTLANLIGGEMWRERRERGSGGAAR